MRIFIDARVLDPTAGHGIARHAQGLLRELASEPGRHTYLVLARPGAAAGLARGRRLEVRLNRCRPYSLAGQAVLPPLLAKLKPDLYYSPTYLPPALNPRPAALTIHDLIHLNFGPRRAWLRRLVWRAIIGPQARRARAVLTVSQQSALDIARSLKVDQSRIEVIGNGLEPAFRPRSRAEVEAAGRRLGLSGPYLVSVGNPRPHKNLAGGVAAFHLLAERGFGGQLVVVGAGQAALPQGPGRVIKASGLSDEETAALYSGAAGAVFPSLAEGFGLPPLEALACLCPVAAFDLPVMREVLGSETAFLARPPRAEALAQALALMLDKPQEAQDRARAGQRQAAQYTWPRAAARLREVFDQIETELKGGRLGR